jgi:hypothetical protein
VRALTCALALSGVVCSGLTCACAGETEVSVVSVEVVASAEAVLSSAARGSSECSLREAGGCAACAS